ncbi:MAG: hypothetical protein M1836_001887 [Candelina mexicana]|nr:MAG: hypothetical protein M1836_001887 [Candelina mexicana]
MVLGNKGVLPLRTFIQETLRRSRTSYSTLQVALYYLILIKAHVPHYDFTMEQPADGQTLRAMQCGRRMFLAALILASKYLQDRNYSSRAWSKISGLNPIEINMNELAFLAAVKWRLHISEKVFQRWTDVVLKYTSSTQPPRSPTSSPTSASEESGWKSIIPKLTPALDSVDLAQTKPYAAGWDTHPNLPAPTKPSSTKGTPQSNSQFGDVTHSHLYSIPRVLEPAPSLVPFVSLPTPRMTPLLSGLSTPAASAEGPPYNRKSAISSAFAKAENIFHERTTLDFRTPQQTVMPCGLESYAICGRRPSLDRSSLVSSPESMVSDNSSRSSRASSISSVASSICAPSQLNLAVQATCRSANLQQVGRKENQRPNLRLSLEWNQHFLTNSELTGSPETYSGPTGAVPDFSKFSLRTPQPTPSPPHALTSDQHVAGGLRDITNKPKSQQPRSVNVVQKSTKDVKGRKRGRSSDDLTLQQRVRGLTASRTEDDSTVLPDRTVADSFLLQSNADLSIKVAQIPLRVSAVRLPLEKEAGRKRACCVEDCSTLMRDRVPGPGMWDGIL